MTKAWFLSPILWILDLKAGETTEVDALLLRTLNEGRLIAGMAHIMTQFGFFTAFAVTDLYWILIINITDLLLFLARLYIANGQRRNGMTGLTVLDQLAVPINLVWMSLISVGIVILFQISSLSASFIGMALAIGFMGYTTTINAAFPRLTVLNLALLGAALTIGLCISPDAELRWLAFLSPCIALGYLTLMRHSHTVIVNAVREQHRHYQMSVHDPLTRLPNRVRLHEHLTSLTSADRKRRSDDGFAVLCLDLDGFKRVNDQFGHAAGDWVLMEVGRLLTDTVRDGDMVSRLGGDEFVALLPRTGRSTATAIAERILAAVSQPIGLGEAIRIQVGISIGIALSPENGTRGNDLLLKADAALYDAKRSGRGCIRFASTEIETSSQDSPALARMA